jgi:DeoR family fructose operon transcriptional repressor
MLAINRHEKIIEWLDQHRSAKVTDLSQSLNVTEKTIREDLEKLEQRGLLKRIHGGAILVAEGEHALLPIFKSHTRQYEEKREIARKAIAYIEERDIIALDGGSTTLEIACALDNIPLTVITNDLNIICELTKKEHIQLVVPGGHRSRNLLITSSEAIEFVSKLNIKKAFISATAIDIDYGLSVFTSAQIELKKTLISCAGEVYAVADHSKFDRCALMTFANLSELKCIISDKGMKVETIERYKEQGILMDI